MQHRTQRPGLWTVIAAALCWIGSVAVASEPLSAGDFAELKRAVRAELESRYAAASASTESFPGATLAFGLRDGRRARFAVGFADVEAARPMALDARMPSGSIGKTFVAALVLDMVAEGSLQLDAGIRTWLDQQPWFDRLPNGDTITLRQLLNHSSGLIDHVFDSGESFPDYLQARLGPADTAPLSDPRDMVLFVLDRKPLFAAGDGFHYSDTAYILAGMIIESAAQAAYYDELERRFLKPLRLDQTTALQQRSIPGLPQGYALESHEQFGLPPEIVANGSLVFDPSIEWTGGGLLTTSADLVRWAQALFAGDAITARCRTEMLTSIAVPEHFGDAPDRSYGYGLGINVARTRLGTTYRHGGFFPGYNSMLVFYPDAGVAIAMQINTDRSSIQEHVEAIATIIIAAVGQQ